MAAFESAYLSPRALRGLNRIGDIICPRHEEYPAFSELGCIVHVDRVVENAPPDDVKQLDSFLALMATMPTFVLRFVVWLAGTGDAWPDAIGSQLRLLGLGLRSVVITLYYSGEKGPDYAGRTPHEIIGFRLNAIR